MAKNEEIMVKSAEPAAQAMRSLRQILLSDEQIADMATMFKMMADPTRLRIINTLMVSELCVRDLAELMQMSQSAVSHQLAALRNSRLIKFRREGKQIFYSLDDEHDGGGDAVADVYADDDGVAQPAEKIWHLAEQ